MAELNGFQILIVDGNPEITCQLHHVLVGRGAKVHVLDSARRALTMARQKRIDGAFVHYDVDRGTRDLCAQLRKLNIPVIFIPHDIARAPREFATRLFDLDPAAVWSPPSSGLDYRPRPQTERKRAADSRRAG